MSYEYHGWIALATSKSDWSDGDFKDAFTAVQKALDALTPEEGHEALLPDSDVLPRVVSLKGGNVDSVDPALVVVKAIVDVFDLSYGEIVVSSDADKPWDFVNTIRYEVLSGSVEKNC